jgi:hypothetical protein
MSMRTLNVIVYGVGAMGGNMVRLIHQRPFLRLVGAIDWDPKKIGRDAGEVAGLGQKLGVPVQFPPETLLDYVQADVVLQATTAFIDEAYPQIEKILEKKIPIVTIAQELFFPLGRNLSKAARIDQLARQAGVGITAVGINPGFIMDIIPIVGSLACWDIRKVIAQRVVDFGPYGPDEMRHIGAGLLPDAFQQGVQDGIIGHIGLLETVAMVAHCLDMPIDELKQTKAPILARTQRCSKFITIQPGQVCGFQQNVTGLSRGLALLDYRLTGIVQPIPEEDGVEMGDYTRIEGTPGVDIRIKEEISQRGGLGTAAVAVNMIPRILESAPGFQTMNQLLLPHYWNGTQPLPYVERIQYF